MYIVVQFSCTLWCNSHVHCGAILMYIVVQFVAQALQEVETEDIVQEERARKAAVRKSKMESDLDAEDANLKEKKGVSIACGFVCDVCCVVVCVVCMLCICCV